MCTYRQVDLITEGGSSGAASPYRIVTRTTNNVHYVIPGTTFIAGTISVTVASYGANVAIRNTAYARRRIASLAGRATTCGSSIGRGGTITSSGLGASSAGGITSTPSSPASVYGSRTRLGVTALTVGPTTSSSSIGRGGTITSSGLIASSAGGITCTPCGPASVYRTGAGATI